MSKSSPVARYVISGLLLVGIAVLAWVALRDVDHTAAAKNRLKVRAQEYAQLRIDGDWSKLYYMVDPAQRRNKSQVEFLKIFGSGALKVHKMDFLEYMVSPNQRVARTKFNTSVELDRSKLPPVAQRLQVPDPSALKKDSIFELDWVFRVSKDAPKGEWYWKMSTQTATGKDPQGNPINTFDNPNGAPPAPAPAGSAEPK